MRGGADGGCCFEAVLLEAYAHGDAGETALTNVAHRNGALRSNSLARWVGSDPASSEINTHKIGWDASQGRAGAELYPKPSAITIAPQSNLILVRGTLIGRAI